MATEPDRSALREFLREFELRAILERLEEGLPEDEAVPGRRVEREIEVEAIEGSPADIASTGPIGISISGERWAGADREPWSPERRAWTSWRSPSPTALSRPTTRNRWAAAATDSWPPRRARGLEVVIDHDTMLGAYLLEPQRRTYELLELAADAGHRGGGGEAGGPRDDGGEGEQLALGEEADVGLEPAEEARIVVELAGWQRARLEEWDLERLLREVELPLVHVLAAMEREGLKLDVERLTEIGSGIGEQIEQLESEIHGLAGREFTIGSPQQVGRCSSRSWG